MVIAGGFGVGKTTAVGSISEIEPLTTEAAITEVAAGVDDLTHTPRKTTTTVAMDFGCLTIDPTLKLYLFGTPGQERFGFMWDDLVEGALGGLVIVDTRRLDDCYAAVDYFEHKDIPFAVAVNAFDGKVEHDPRRGPLGAGRLRTRPADRLRRPRRGLGPGRPAGRPGSRPVPRGKHR